MVSDSFSIEHSTSGSEAYIATFRNTANDNSFSNHGINVIAGHDSYNSSNKSRLIKFTTPDDNSLGRIQQNATGSLAYNVTSDIRLKTNIQPTKYGLNDLLKIQVSDYFYKNDASKTPQTGFIAQQLHRIYPVAVTVGGDNEKVNPWMVDYAKLTPLLVKGIQTQQVLLDKLTMENGQLDKKQTSQQTAIESLTVQANTNHTNIQQLEQQLLILSELQKESESMKAMLKQIQGQLN
ncbi:MAG: tail fiber domain-containing protein [Bacteroidota bacterium]